MELVKRDPLFVVVDSEEQDLQYSIMDIERRLYEIGSSIRGLMDHKSYLEIELESKRRKQEECRKKKDDCSKVCAIVLLPRSSILCAQYIMRCTNAHIVI